MTKISEQEFARICEGIYDDRKIIWKHNPIGTRDEILLWMLTSCLVSYLNLSEIETPCFTGKPDAETYREAIMFILKDRKAEDFDAEKYLKILDLKLNFRIAEKSDFEQLANLRWAFRMENGDERAAMSQKEFVKKCVEFFEAKADGDYHIYWIAEEEGEILSHIFVHKIDMIPRPCKIEDRFGYITNNYTKPEFRGKGIGTRLLEKVIEWAKAEDLELLIVYPSEKSQSFYERKGFKTENEVMELTLREYYSEDWIDKN